VNKYRVGPPGCRALLGLLAGLVLLLGCASRPIAEPFATGLNQPRGMAFDAAGNLFVAEAGALDPADVGEARPETNHSGRVLRIDSGGHVSAVVQGLPYTHYEISGDVGAADVAVLGQTLYLLTGEGYDDQLSRSVLRALPGGPLQPVASLLTFAIGTTPIEQQMVMGGAPSNPYAMAAAPDGSALYVTDGASGRVLRVALDGNIRAFAQLPQMPPLTGLAFGPDGKLYVTMFSTLPHAPGSGAIWAADASGALSSAAAGLTMPIDVGFDALGTIYVLEFSDGGQPSQPYAAGSGRLLRVERDGARTTLLDRLDYPTAMVFSSAGDLYIAVGGAFSAPGQGAILKVPCPALGVPETCAARPAP
jgi:DNA-binding beta-propeller fold protein YncE